MTQAMGEVTRDRADFCGFVQKRAYITAQGTAAQAQTHNSRHAVPTVRKVSPWSKHRNARFYLRLIGV
jgi:hypothetical protein